MAVIYPTYPESDAEIIQVLWEALGASDTGLPVKLVKYSGKSSQIFGTFDTTTITLQGSNDPRANPENVNHASAVWFSLTDPQGNAIAKTAAAGEEILENPMWIRPISSGGAGTDIDVSIVAKRNI